MLSNIKGSNQIPYGYGVGNVKKVEKVSTDVKKDGEKERMEQKKKLLAQKALLEKLQKESNPHHFDKRI